MPIVEALNQTSNASGSRKIKAYASPAVLTSDTFVHSEFL